MRNDKFIEEYIKQLATVTPEIENLLYWNKVTVFVDLLGFKSLVWKNESYWALQANILPTLRQLESLADCNNAKDFTILANQRQVTTFSDSIVLSYSAVGAIKFLAHDLATVVRTILGNGLLFRGGIAFGKLHHIDKTVVGDGLIRAYEIESKEAIHPRIVVDGPVIRILRRLLAPPFAEAYEIELYNRALFRDTDKRYIVDIAHLPGLDNCIAQVRSIIEHADRTSSQVLRKINWLETYHTRIGMKNKTVSRVRFSPDKSTYS